MNLLERIRTLYALRPAAEHELPEVAQSVAIIMDGNGRWAKRRGENQVQKLTDEHTKTIDDLLKHKEAEIMEV